MGLQPHPRCYLPLLLCPGFWVSPFLSYFLPSKIFLRLVAGFCWLCLCPASRLASRGMSYGALLVGRWGRCEESCPGAEEAEEYPKCRPRCRRDFQAHPLQACPGFGALLFWSYFLPSKILLGELMILEPYLSISLANPKLSLTNFRFLANTVTDNPYIS